MESAGELAKGIGPGTFIARLIFESLLLGGRLAVSVAVVAFVVYLGMRVTRQRDLTLDQCFNAVAFAFAPIIVGPLVALVAVFEPNLLIPVGVVILLIGLRALADLALNLRAILPLAVAGLAFVVALASGAIVLGDQVSRVRMTAFAIAPQLASPLAAAPAQGKRYDLPSATLNVVTSAPRISRRWTRSPTRSLVPSAWVSRRRGVSDRSRASTGM